MINHVSWIELSDEQWEHIERLLQASPRRRGRPRANDRRILNGILYVLLRGVRWEDVPRSFASPGTCWRRYQEWASDGTWERVWLVHLSLLSEADKRLWAEAFLKGSFIPMKKGKYMRSRM